MYAWLADTLTLSRIVAAGVLIWLGLAYGATALPAAVAVTMLAWTTDQLDGWAARRSAAPTRLGPYDFPIDAIFYLGILGYLVTAGFLPVAIALIFLALAIAAWLSTRRKAVGVLCLRLVDLFGASILFSEQPLLGFIVLGWLLILAVLYRQRLAERVPRWLKEISSFGPSRAEPTTSEGSAPTQPFDNHSAPL